MIDVAQLSLTATLLIFGTSSLVIALVGMVTGSIMPDRQLDSGLSSD
jgi:hypothetical protein